MGSGAFVSRSELGGGVPVTEGLADGARAKGALRDVLSILGSFVAAFRNIVSARAAPLSATTVDHLDPSRKDFVSWACLCWRG